MPADTEDRLYRARKLAALAEYVTWSQLWVHKEGDLAEPEVAGLQIVLKQISEELEQINAEWFAPEVDAQEVARG